MCNAYMLMMQSLYYRLQCTVVLVDMVLKDSFWWQYTVEPSERGQHGDEPFVLSREVVLFQRFFFLSLKMKSSSCLDTNTIDKRECNQLSHKSVDVGFFCKRLPCVSCKDGLLLVLSINGGLDNAHYSHTMYTTIREPLPALSP